MPGRRRRVDEIPPVQAAVVGVNIRVLRQQHGSNQSMVGDLMGWPSNSTVCAAEGRRNGRQRGFTAQTVFIRPTLLSGEAVAGRADTDKRMDELVRAGTPIVSPLYPRGNAGGARYGPVTLVGEGETS
jgi:hypothetical protein